MFNYGFLEHLCAMMSRMMTEEDQVSKEEPAVLHAGTS